jgi:hypothetical protein
VIWADERMIPEMIIRLLEFPELPSELRVEIQLANRELNSTGAVTYPTKANIEHYVHKYAALLSQLAKDKYGDD